MDMGTGERCPWACTPLEIAYHDDEWCRPCHDEKKLFEFLELEGMQAGLSWRFILERRAAFNRVYAGFDPAVLARWGAADVERALAAPGVLKNRRKAESVVTNARAFLNVQEEWGSFDAYLWSWAEGTPRINRWTDQAQMPAESPLSAALSADLKKRGFRFVGPVICYSYLQAAGLVNDHLVSCPFYEACGGTV